MFLFSDFVKLLWRFAAKRQRLARNSHEFSAAAADPGMSAAAPIHAEHELGALG